MLHPALIEERDVLVTRETLSANLCNIEGVSIGILTSDCKDRKALLRCQRTNVVDCLIVCVKIRITLFSDLSALLNGGDATSLGISDLHHKLIVDCFVDHLNSICVVISILWPPASLVNRIDTAI